MLNRPPDPDELELSIFGPGIGESIAIHVGGGFWILVDSCIDPESNYPSHLNYLSNLGIDISQSVLLIAATHWHADHIKGLSIALEKCEDAAFVMSNALRSNEFLELVTLYKKTAIQNVPTTDEISKVFGVLKNRRQASQTAPVLAISDRLLLQKSIQLSSQVIDFSAYALSPSDVSCLKSMSDFLAWLEKGSPLSIDRPSNHPSVAMWIKIDGESILLGADLERTSDPETGWSIIITGSNVIRDTARVFKIPHHGSENAHHDEVWRSILSEEPYAIVTPYGRGRKPLPSDSDRARISSLTSNGYATAPTVRRRVRFRDRSTSRTFDRATKSAYSISQRSGHVRLRKKLGSNQSDWHVELFGEAYSLNQ